MSQNFIIAQRLQQYKNPKPPPGVLTVDEPKDPNPSFNKSLTLSNPFNTQRSLSNRFRDQILSIPIKNEEALRVFTMTKHKLRGMITLLKYREELLDLGTYTGLFDVWGNYRSNLENLLYKKTRKAKIEERNNEDNLGCLFAPNSKFKQGWNLVILLLMIYVFIFTPWIIAFEDVEYFSFLYFFEMSIDFLFFCDILITMNSAYYEHGQIVVNRWKIFKNYLTGLLIIDIVAIFPFDAFNRDSSGTSSQSNSLIRIIRITKVTRVFRASKLMKVIKHLAKSEWMDKIREFMNTYGGITRLLSVAYGVLIMAHFTACMWYFTAKLDDLGPDTWVVRYGYADSGKGHLYLASLYWAFTVLTAVGYGNIAAFTESEMILCVIWMLFGIGFYSLLVGTITSFIFSFDAKSSLVKQNVQEVRQFAEQFCIDEETRNLMKKEVIHKSEGNDFMETESRVGILEKLSKELRYEVCMDMYTGAIHKVNFLAKQDRIFISYLVPRLNFVMKKEHSYVYKRNDHPEFMYFVPKGRVCYVVGEKNTIFKTIVEGSYFGEIEVFEKCRRKFTVITSSECEFLTLEKHLISTLSDHYPLVYKKLREQSLERDVINAKAKQEVSQLLAYVKLTNTNLEKLVGTDPKEAEMAINIPDLQIPHLGDPTDETSKIRKKIENEIPNMKASLEYVKNIMDRLVDLDLSDLNNFNNNNR